MPSWPPDTDPKHIAVKAFRITRRGFDPAEVRTYLQGLSETVAEAMQQITQLEDQLALGGAARREEGRSAERVTQLEAQVRSLTDRLAVANAVRADAVKRADELERRADRSTSLSPDGTDELDRASSELAQVLREARVRAAQIRADAQRSAETMLEHARREREQSLHESQILGEEAVVRLRDRLDAIARDAEKRVSAANLEAERVLAVADEQAARTVEHGLFQARRLVAEAGSFSAIWVSETEEMRNALQPSDPAVPLGLGRTADEALAAFTARLQTQPDATADAMPPAVSVAAAAGAVEASHATGPAEDAVEPGAAARSAPDPEQLLREADQLLSIAEVVRRAEAAPNGRSGASRLRPAARNASKPTD